MALTENEKPTYTTSVWNSVAVLNQATAGALGSDTNGITIYTAPQPAGAIGTRVETLLINTNDTAIVNVFIYILDTDNATVIPQGIVTVPASSGNSASVATVDAFSASGISLLGMKRDNTGKFYLDLAPAQTLKCSVLANMTSGKKCWVSAGGGNYN